MTGGSDACRNSVLVRYLRNREHGEVKKLTASPTAVVAASGRASKTLVDGDGGWREKHGAGEVESGQIKAKKGNLRHLRSRGSTAELQETSATAIELRNGGLPCGGGDWSGERRKGGGRASDSGFIGGDEVL